MSDLDLPSKTEIADELNARGLPSRLVDPLARKLSKEPKEPVTKAGLDDHVAAVLNKVDKQLEQGERVQLLHYTDQIVAAMAKLTHKAAPKPAKAKAKDDDTQPASADDPITAEGSPPVGETS